MILQVYSQPWINAAELAGGAPPPLQSGSSWSGLHAHACVDRMSNPADAVNCPAIMATSPGTCWEPSSTLTRTWC